MSQPAYKIVTIYVIRWWETKGILKLEAVAKENKQGKFICYARSTDEHPYYVFEEKEAYLDRNDAVLEVERLRLKRIAELNKQLAKLEGMVII